VDIHSHILCGLDDGPATLEESIANFDYAFSPEATDEKIRELAQASGGALRIHRGCDYHPYSKMSSAHWPTLHASPSTASDIC
jgi:hypothetical protein